MLSQTNGELGFDVSFGETLIVAGLLLLFIALPFALMVWALATIISHNGLDGRSKLLWVIVCALLPFIGSLVWLFFGKKRADENASGLVPMPPQSRTVAARTLDVSTANLSPDTDEKIIIITLDETAFEAVRLIDAPLRLTTPSSRPVTFSTGVTGGDPTLDPNQGWIIPVTLATQQELNALPAGRGEHELTTLHLALIVVS